MMASKVGISNSQQLTRAVCSLGLVYILVAHAFVYAVPRSMRLDGLPDLSTEPCSHDISTSTYALISIQFALSLLNDINLSKLQGLNIALPASMVNALINFTIAALIYFTAISSDSFVPVALTVLTMSLNLLVLIFGEPIFEKSQKFSAQAQTVTQQVSGGLERRLSSHRYFFFVMTPHKKMMILKIGLLN